MKGKYRTESCFLNFVYIESVYLLHLKANVGGQEAYNEVKRDA